VKGFEGPEWPFGGGEGAMWVCVEGVHGVNENVYIVKIG
jgi:hypothetical protein